MRWIRFTLGALGALLLVFATGAELGLGARPLQQEPLACLGETRSLIGSSGMPYTPVRVQGRTGFCRDGELRRAGFLPLSSRDYYGTSGTALRCPAAPRRGGCPNIPMIPLRIGSVGAVAQVDTGYADGLRPPSMNINRALLRQLERAGVALAREPGADLTLSSCVRGEVERVLAYRLPAGRAVELVGSDGGAVRRLAGVTLFLKDSPAAIQACGGIGTWSEPAAQLGASFVNDGTLIADPFSQRLWFRGGSRSPVEAWPIR